MEQIGCVELVKRKRDDRVRFSVNAFVAVLLSAGLTTFACAADLDSLKDPLAADASQDWSRFDPYRVREWNIPLPGPQGTVTQDAGGLRDVFASYGLGWLGYSSDGYSTNAASHGTPIPQTAANQQYIGQLPTYATVNSLYLTYDLSRIGLPGGQLLAGASYFNSSVPSILGRNEVTLSSLIYYQSLFNKTVEVQVGYIPASLEYTGTYIGGSLLGGVFGPNALVPAEVGLGATQYPTLGGNVMVHLPYGFYTKMGIGRAVSPDGVSVEIVENNNGFATSVPHAGIEYIDEAGFLQKPASGVMGTWIRGDFTYNTSDYLIINSSGTKQNRLISKTERKEGENGILLLADRQILQTSPEFPHVGFYVGASYFYSPSDLNLFNKYYEARAYFLGPIPGRPFDQLNFVFADQIFSPPLVAWASQSVIETITHQKTHSDAKTFSVQYSYNLMHGLNFNLGVGYTDHPTLVQYASGPLPVNPITHTAGISAATGSSLNVTAGVAFFW